MCQGTPLLQTTENLAQVVCGTMGLPTATVQMRGPDGIARNATGLGTGPVDAAYKAIDALVRVQVSPFLHPFFLTYLSGKDWLLVSLCYLY